MFCIELQAAESVFFITVNKMPGFFGTAVLYITQKIAPLIHITH